MDFDQKVDNKRQKLENLASLYKIVFHILLVISTINKNVTKRRLWSYF